MDANGENPVQVTFSENENEFFPLVSPDGNWLYYVQRGPKTAAVWRKSLVDEKTERLTETGKVSPSNFISLAPDGKFLAFHNLTETVEAEEGKQTFQICVIPTEEPREPRFITIPASRGSLRSTSDGVAFDYVENTPDGAKIWRQSLDEKTPPQLILDLPKDHIFSFAWSMDSKNLALARGRHLYDAVLLTNFQP
jgi:Tol biopolymer transport system component